MSSAQSKYGRYMGWVFGARKRFFSTDKDLPIEIITRPAQERQIHGYVMLHSSFSDKDLITRYLLNFVRYRAVKRGRKPTISIQKHFGDI